MLFIRCRDIQISGQAIKYAIPEIGHRVTSTGKLKLAAARKTRCIAKLLKMLNVSYTFADRALTQKIWRPFPRSLYSRFHSLAGQKALAQL